MVPVDAAEKSRRQFLASPRNGSRNLPPGNLFLHHFLPALAFLSLSFLWVRAVSFTHSFFKPRENLPYARLVPSLGNFLYHWGVPSKEREARKPPLKCRIHYFREQKRGIQSP